MPVLVSDVITHVLNQKKSISITFATVFVCSLPNSLVTYFWDDVTTVCSHVIILDITN